ncbi:hypothetical protein [Moumouvirus maliensis]|nr:hypothetical protein [Moumouvirus maliensis]
MTYVSKNRPTHGRPYCVQKNNDDCHCKSNNLFNFPNFPNFNNNNNNVFPNFVNNSSFNWPNNNNFCNFSPFQQQESRPVVYHRQPEKHNHHNHCHKVKPAQKNCHC